MDGTLTGTMTPTLSGPRSNGSEEVLHTVQNWSLTIKFFFVSYPGNFILAWELLDYIVWG